MPEFRRFGIEPRKVRPSELKYASVSVEAENAWNETMKGARMNNRDHRSDYGGDRK